MDIMDSYDRGEIEDWKAILLRRKELDFRMFDGFNALIQPPQTTFYKDLMHQYPDAKFILEDITGKTWRKRNARLHNTIRLLFFLRPFKKSRDLFSLVDLMTYMHTKGAKNKLTIEKQWEDFSIKVTKEIPTNRLLIFNRNSDWEQLCEFLEKPIPSVPLPLNNDNKTIKRTIQHVTVTGSQKSRLYIALYFGVLISIFIYLIFFY